jgi:hypothetical protein
LGECNPVIFREFVDHVLESSLAPIIWEPFAGHTRHNFDHCQGFNGYGLRGLQLLAQDIDPTNEWVFRGDSTLQGPPQRPSGLFFHPPYFGSTSFTPIEGELSMITDEEKYFRALTRTITLANLFPGGLACAISRVYRHDGRVIDLPWRFLEIFVQGGYKLIGIWSSEPDMVLIFRRSL